MSKISLKHSGGNVVSLNSPTNAPGAADVAFKLPNADGSNGQALVTDGAGNLSFANAGSGTARNLIINGAMIISQRGVNFGTLASAAYTLDRWNVDAGATVQQASLAVDEISDDKKLTKAIQMQGASSDYFRTKLEDVSNFSSQTLTLSFYVKGASNTTLDNIYARQNFGSGGSSVVDTAFSNLSYSVTTSYTRYTSTVTLPSISGKTVGTSSYLEIFMELPDGVTVYITGVQLEVGSVATDFEHRSFGQELALCQRYFHTLEGDDNDFLEIGFSVNCNNHYMQHNFPQPMRIMPSYSSTSTNIDLLTANSSTNINANTLAIVGPNNTPNPYSCWLYGNTACSTTAGQAAVFRPNANGLVMSFSSEL